MSIFSQIFGNGFDSAAVESSSDYDTLPPGKYPIAVEKAEVKTTKKGDGHYLEVCVQIVDGPSKGRKLWSRMNIDNPSEVAQRIGLSQLAGLCKACGVEVIRDENELLGKSCIANVKVKDDQNEIRSWSSLAPIGSGAAYYGPHTPTVEDRAKADAKANVTTVQPVSAPSGNKPPWAR